MKQLFMAASLVLSRIAPVVLAKRDQLDGILDSSKTLNAGNSCFPCHNTSNYPMPSATQTISKTSAIQSHVFLEQEQLELSSDAMIDAMLSRASMHAPMAPLEKNASLQQLVPQQEFRPGSKKGMGLFCDCLEEKDLPHDRANDDTLNFQIIYPDGFFSNKAKVFREIYTRIRQFGTFCAAHDEGTAPYCNSENGEPPDWCKKRWCFIKEECACDGVKDKQNGEMKVKDAELSLIRADNKKRVWFSYLNCDPGGEGVAKQHQAAFLDDPAAYESYQKEKGICTGVGPLVDSAKDDESAARHQAQYGAAIVAMALSAVLVVSGC